MMYDLRDSVYGRHDETINWYAKLKLQFHILQRTNNLKV